MKTQEIICDSSDSNKRIDIFLTEKFDSYSRSYIQREIKNGNILVNGKIVKSNYIINGNEKILFNIEEPKNIENVEPHNMNLDILYEDDDYIFVNKPKGMVVHPAPGHYEDTLVNGLLFYANNSLSGINGILRPGIVHRIDKDTTGVIVTCKNDDAHKYMAGLLEKHDIKRTYRLLVYGVMKDDEGVIDQPIGRHPVDRKRMAINVKNSKRAITHYKVLERFSRYTYLECNLETGRTHQIRVHMASIHHPLVGDEVYSKNPKNAKFQGQILHAATLGFKNFRNNREIFIEAPMPNYFVNVLEHLRKYDSL